MTLLAKKLSIFSATLVTAGVFFWSQRQALLETQRESRRQDGETTRLLKTARELNDECEKTGVAIRDLEQRARTIEKQTVATAASFHGMTPPSSSQSGGTAVRYVALRKSNLNRMEFKPVGDDYRVTDEAAAILGLTAAERAAVDKAGAGVVAKHGELDLASARKTEDHLTSEEGRKTTFKVPAYPEEGRKMAAGLISAMQAAIGEQRTQVLMEHADLNSLSGDGFEPFGRTEKTITFLDRESADGNRGDCKIFLKVVDTATGYTLTSSFANTDDSIPGNWRHLIESIIPRP